MIPWCYVAYRVYSNVGKSIRSDERGVYKGLGSKYDDWVALYSPFFAPHLSRAGKQTKSTAKRKIDTQLDDHIKPLPGFERVFACPRIATCISKKFLSFMDMFGNKGGFD